ncbi:FYVE domain-containing protein/PTB domain-containing protein [Cephalotus follicularis]|uniref:FYVE domain-containing protein/PTB domain-containing protein n=1 Tax=Cephalotus follicularis TaxID=3775 RepID=A0A1Q3AMD0_CEPFO|nr:FYVE domain-containing protein/PTB domain-containing protein [Cephalotus follicularis]
MQKGDYSSYYPYPHLQNPNPIDPNPSPYASAPPFATSYNPSDFSSYPATYHPYPQNPDPVPPSPNPNSFNYDPHGPYQPPVSQQLHPPTFDQQHLNYAPPNPNSNPNPIPNPPFSSFYSAPYGSAIGSSGPPVYENSYDSSVKFDHAVGVTGGGYLDDKHGGGYNNQSRSDLGSDPYVNRSYDLGKGHYDAYEDGVYAYEGGKVEPYGARGTAPKSSTWAAFDDYGRAISFPSVKDSPVGSGSGSAKIVRAVPKVETQRDVKGGVQKFRVKLLAESGGQSTMDVLCQVGLDGIRMLDPSTSRTLRIYPLENITRCDKTDSSTFAFWSKSSVDIEPRRIRLQSNSYTANTLLDTVTAAVVQVKEIGERTKPSDAIKTAENLTEKKKGFVDWVNLMKPGNEEKDHWVPDEAVSKCTACGTDFGAFVRKHHCRNCGDIFCDKCTHGRIALTAEENAQPVRVCDRCMAEVTQRLSNAKEAASKPAVLQSHEDLARKLQEEMEKNRKASTGTKSDGSGRRMREVACPICTVHLQVQVPSSGSETIECGVCQHPFLVEGAPDLYYFLLPELIEG